MISSIASLGVFVSVPVIGAAILGFRRLTVSRLASIHVIVAIGLTVWSVPMLGTLILRVYHPEILGAAGWIIALAIAFTTRRRWIREIQAPSRWTLVLLAALTVAFLVYAVLPSDPLVTARDMGVYSAHGAYLAEHGRLDVPYPDGISVAAGLPIGWVGLAGVYATAPTQTVQFGHLYPAWLAQAYAVGGFEALIRLNAVFAPLALLGVFGVARRWLPAPIAVLAVAFVALNASEVWVTRTTLTEILTQLLIWSGFVLLVQTAHDRRRLAMLWAGAFVGMAAVVRIDSLVMLPLFLAGWAVAELRDGETVGQRQSIPFLAAALPLFFLATCYYAGFTNPYFTDLGSQLRTIGLAAIAGAALYAATYVRPVRDVLGRLIGSPAFLAVAAVVTVALAVFAYFIRPTIEPFDLLNLPGLRRSHIEDAMRNLGAYLGPPTVWLAVAGWLGATILAVRRQPLLLPVLIVVGGYSALYFWNMSITPDHFWAIRRFIPIIVPAAVIFAAVAGWWILQRFPRRVQPYLFGLAALALAAQTWRVGTPLFFVAERSGSYETLEAVAEAIPDGVAPLPIMNLPGVRSLVTPLDLVFGEQIPAIAATDDAGRAEVISQLRTASHSNPLTVITNIPQDAEMLIGNTLGAEEAIYEFVLPTMDPVPSQTMVGGFALIVREVVDVTTLGVNFGGYSSWLVADEGFHGEERISGEALRWTDGDASLVIPVVGGTADQLHVDIAAAAPDGSDLRIVVDGMELARMRIPQEGWSGTFDLADAGDLVEVQLISDTFVPSEVIPGSEDIRSLGVDVRSVTLLGTPDN